MSKTNNPKRLCSGCGAEILIAPWVECSCGALIHFKIDRNGRAKKTIFHSAGKSPQLKIDLSFRKINIVQVAMKID